MPPAAYRIDGGNPVSLGDCAGLLVEPGQTVTIHVGQELDLHMTTAGEPNATDLPFYALPVVADQSIVRLIGSDGRTTVSYKAASPGEVAFDADGQCVGTNTNAATACPILTVRVIPA